MLIQIMILCHWLATLWHGLAQIEIYYGETNTWLHFYNIEDCDWYDRYAFSFYSSLSMALMIGANANTTVEVLCTIGILFGTVGVFAYLLSSISLLIEELNKKDMEYKHDMELINTYMRKNQIDKNIQAKIRQYIEYGYQDREQMKHNTAAKSLLDKLPKLLNNEIISEINLKLIKKVNFFQKNFSSQTLKNLAKIAQEKHYVTNDIIINTDHDNEHSLYLVNHGEVDICFQGLNQALFSVQKVQQGGILGDLSFASGFNKNFIARTNSFVTLLKIPRKDFLEILKCNKQDYEKFMIIKDEIQIKQKSEWYQRPCIICDSSTHSEFNCYMISVKPNIQKTIYKHLNYEWMLNSRTRYFRDRKKQNAKKLVQDLEEVFDSIDMGQEYDKFKEFYEKLLIYQIAQDYQDEEQLHQLDYLEEYYKQQLQNQDETPQNINQFLEEKIQNDHYKKANNNNEQLKNQQDLEDLIREKNLSYDNQQYVIDNINEVNEEEDENSQSKNIISLNNISEQNQNSINNKQDDSKVEHL